MPSIVAPLLAWYDKVKRDLPWRHDVTPYGVWVSEIMLQQTRVEAVRAYYVRWMRALPTVYDLAQADDERLHKLWEGLGYYSRVQNLKKAAVMVVEHYGGRVPSDPAELRRLPGVGDYTAGAIASIAYGVRVPAVDGNVLRVLARLRGDDTDILLPKARENAVSWLMPILPEDRVGDFTQAMFEWGAMVCTPKNPDCARCPVRDECEAYRTQRVGQLPVRINKTKRAVADVTVLVVCCAGRYALVPPKPKGLLAGMYGLPLVESALSEEQAAEWATERGMQVKALLPLAAAKHVFSHVTWYIRAYRLDVDCTDASFVWATPSDVADRYALPAAYGAYRGELL